MNRTLIVILASLPLCGCIADQKQQVASCTVKAMQTYPGDTLNVFSPSLKMADFVQTCMAAAGFKFACPGYPALSDRYRCYQPDSVVGNWAYRAERILTRDF